MPPRVTGWGAGSHAGQRCKDVHGHHLEGLEDLVAKADHHHGDEAPHERAALISRSLGGLLLFRQHIGSIREQALLDGGILVVIVVAARHGCCCDGGTHGTQQGSNTSVTLAVNSVARLCHCHTFHTTAVQWHGVHSCDATWCPTTNLWSSFSLVSSTKVYDTAGLLSEPRYRRFAYHTPQCHARHEIRFILVPCDIVSSMLVMIQCLGTNCCTVPRT